MITKVKFLVSKDQHTYAIDHSGGCILKNIMYKERAVVLDILEGDGTNKNIILPYNALLYISIWEEEELVND